MSSKNPQVSVSLQEGLGIANPNYTRRSIFLLMKIISGTFGFLLTLTPGIVPILFIYVANNRNQLEIVGTSLMAIPFLIIGINMIRSLVLTRKPFNTSWKYLSYYQNSLRIFGHMKPKYIVFQKEDIESIELGEREQKSFESDFNLFKIEFRINSNNNHHYDFGTIFESRHATITSNNFSKIKNELENDFLIVPLQQKSEQPSRRLRNIRRVLRVSVAILCAILGVIFYTQF